MASRAENQSKGNEPYNYHLKIQVLETIDSHLHDYTISEKDHWPGKMEPLETFLHEMREHIHDEAMGAHGGPYTLELKLYPTPEGRELESNDPVQDLTDNANEPIDFERFPDIGFGLNRMEYLLDDAGIKTNEQLANLKEPGRIKGIGEKSAKAIQKYLERNYRPANPDSQQ